MGRPANKSSHEVNYAEHILLSSSFAKHFVKRTKLQSSYSFSRIQEPKLVTFPKLFGEHFDMYFGVSAGRLLLW